MGPPPGQALRRRLHLRRAELRREVQRPVRLPRPRDPQAREDRPRRRGPVPGRQRRPRAGRSSSTAGRWPRTCSSWAPAADRGRTGSSGGQPPPTHLRARRPSTAHDAGPSIRAGRCRPRSSTTWSTWPAARPSAGKAQGWHLVVLEGADTARFWDVTLPPERRSGFAWPGLLDAPVIALPLADPEAYVRRYGEPDKAASGLGRSARGLAGALLDGGRRLRGHDAPAGGRGAGSGRAVLRRLPGRGRSCAPRSGCPPTWSCWAPSPWAGPPDAGPGPPGPLGRPPAACPGGDHPPGRVVRLRSRPGCRTSPAGRCSPAGWRR